MAGSHQAGGTSGGGPPRSLYSRQPMNNPYPALPAQVNDGPPRTLLSSGPAVVGYRLAVTSKDGDWIVREDAEATGHVLRVLSRHGAAYRFGAPLDVR